MTPLRSRKGRTVTLRRQQTVMTDHQKIYGLAEMRHAVVRSVINSSVSQRDSFQLIPQALPCCFPVASIFSQMLKQLQ
jgi:hypothetical protein